MVVSSGMTYLIYFHVVKRNLNEPLACAWMTYPHLMAVQCCQWFLRGKQCNMSSLKYSLSASQAVWCCARFSTSVSGGSRISHRGERAPVGGGVDLRCRCFSVKMYVKMKESGPIRGGVRPACPPRSANECLFWNQKMFLWWNPFPVLQNFWFQHQHWCRTCYEAISKKYLYYQHSNFLIGNCRSCKGTQLCFIANTHIQKK